MKNITEQNLINAFGGESMAHMRYLHFSFQASRENYHNVARLFRAIAYAEYIHAGDHFAHLRHLEGAFPVNAIGGFGPGNTMKNLQLAIAGETYEIEEMYPAYIEVATLQEEKGARRSFEWAYGTEKMHKALFEKAALAVREKSDMRLGVVQVCDVCGYTTEGEAPDKCPLCDARKERFERFA